MRCPRRSESVWGSKPGEDQYDEHDDGCTYCGSLNPDILMKRLEAGDVSIDPTDKSYKIYVHNAGGEGFKQHYRNCYDMEKQQGSDFVKCKGPDSCTHWVTRDTSQAKFYFQHLSVEQQQRFIELLNEKKLKINFPGRFYVLPYFITMENK